MNTKVALIGLLVISLALFAGCAAKQEHPVGIEEEHSTEEGAEHPAGEGAEEGKEHPAEGSEGEAEHPAEEQVKKGVTKDELAEAIEEYVARDAKLKGGYFMVYDGDAQEPLLLKLDLVHKERLSRVAENVYFACADFKTPGGETYDLDVFMRGTAKSNLEVTEVNVHKEEGEARYTWYEEGGIWKKKYAEEKEEPEAAAPEHPAEHPEHPE